MTKKHPFIPLAYLLVYFCVGLIFLVDFPFVHSDEAWLGGLSREMLARGSLGVTEPFFDLKVRHPHAIKSLFHLAQELFISVFGYNIFSLRLLSLVVGCVCLFVFYKCALRLFDSEFIALCAMVLLSVDIQFIYTCHFARNDIFILLGVCLCLFILSDRALSPKKTALLSLVTGLCIFIHPNSFFVGCTCGTVLLYMGYKEKNYSFLLKYILYTLPFAIGAVGISFGMDGNFIKNYFAYGQADFSVLAPLGEKIGGLWGFFSRLLKQNSGTYYVPRLLFQSVLFPLCALICLGFGLVMKREFSHMSYRIFTLIASIVGLVGGITLLGRFSQTSIVFLFPAMWLLVVFAVKILAEKHQKLVLTALIIVTFSLSALEIAPHFKAPSYGEYLGKISATVPRDASVIANLNADFYFDNGCLYDYRNLPFIKDVQQLEEYVSKHKIEYIIYSDELDFIYQNRPYYNVIYGNIMFLEPLKEFCTQHCTVAGEFFDGQYGVRIISLLNGGEYGNVTVYKVSR
ncbi:MAG: glycosyltransferase family 39 protein [Oscillospiraceae bacterium]